MLDGFNESWNHCGMAQSLPDFIRGLGVDKAAALLGQKPRTVMSWMYRDRRPRPETAQELIERSNGRLSMASIYGAAK